MTAEELLAHVEAISPVVDVLADALTADLPLTAEEEEALGIADAALRIGALGAALSGNKWANAAAALVSAVPACQIVRLIESWRKIRIAAEDMSLIVGPLGSGVVIEGRG